MLNLGAVSQWVETMVCFALKMGGGATGFPFKSGMNNVGLGMFFF